MRHRLPEARFCMLAQPGGMMFDVLATGEGR